MTRFLAGALLLALTGPANAAEAWLWFGTNSTTTVPVSAANPLPVTATGGLTVMKTDGSNSTSAAMANILSSASSAAQTPAGQWTFIAPILGTPASGVATNLTGTAAGLTAGNVTTNANMTGPVTSIGNATAFATMTSNAFLTGNGTALPHSVALTGLVLGNGASAPTAVSYTAKTNYSPTITCGSGTIGTYSTQLGTYQVVGGTTFVSIDVQAAIGTCSGTVKLSLPNTADVTNLQTLTAYDQTTGLPLSGFMSASTTVQVLLAVGGNPVVTNRFVVTGTYLN